MPPLIVYTWESGLQNIRRKGGCPMCQLWLSEVSTHDHIRINGLDAPVGEGVDPAPQRYSPCCSQPLRSRYFHRVMWALTVWLPPHNIPSSNPDHSWQSMLRLITTNYTQERWWQSFFVPVSTLLALVVWKSINQLCWGYSTTGGLSRLV